ncbi:MAG TPA: nitroreductase family protein [Euryarchaeota archaeon]|nr:nitroreductase family protein [Euryarchaeota archaeon]
MELSEAIIKRASVRFFKEDPIDDKIIEELIEAAIRAPTASALENWLFYVIKDENARKKVFEAIKEGHIYYYKLRGFPEDKIKKLEERIRAGMYWAPVYIAVFVEKGVKVTSDDKEYEDLEFIFAVESASAAIENLMLKAVEHSLGTCWIGVTSYPKFAKVIYEICGLNPEKHFLVALIPVGCPSTEISQRERKKGIKEVMKII